MSPKILFAAIAPLAVVLRNLAGASAAPYVGEDSTLDRQSLVTFYSALGG